LSCHSFHFFVLAPLVLCYSSCTSLQVAEAAQNFCVHLLVVPDSLPAGLFPVSAQLAYQHFCAPGFLHRFVVEGCSGLGGPWVPYPIHFSNEFHPGFALAHVVLTSLSHLSMTTFPFGSTCVRKVPLASLATCSILVIFLALVGSSSPWGPLLLWVFFILTISV
jgi:hypothetical protein